MSYKVRSQYTKPNAEVSLHTPPVGYTNLINTMFDAGKITQKPVETIDGLNYTYELIFVNEEAFNEFLESEFTTENYNTRESHCSSNSISYSVEQGV